MILNFKKMTNKNHKIFKLVKTQVWTLIILLAIITVSCYKITEIEIEKKETKNKIVLNGILDPEKNIKVNISRSKNLHDTLWSYEYSGRKNDIYILKDFDVYLYENEVFIGQLLLDTNYNYSINYKPIAGNTYKIVAKNHESGTIQAETIIPTKVLNMQVSNIQELGDKISFDISLKDHIINKKYYSFFMRVKYYKNIEPHFESPPELLSGGDIDLEYEPFYQFFALDKSLSDQNYTFKIHISKSRGIKYVTENTDTCTLYFDLFSVSEDLSKYLTSYFKQLDVVNENLATPVIVFSNVTNGLGILGSQNKYRDSVIYTPRTLHISTGSM